MTIEERANIAANLKATGQCNCTQSVLKVFEDKINIAPEDLVSKFNEKCGATICKDLKGITTGKVICDCPECVRNAVISIGEVLAST